MASVTTSLYPPFTSLLLVLSPPPPSLSSSLHTIPSPSLTSYPLFRPIHPLRQRRSLCRATGDAVLAPESAAVQKAQQIAPALADDGVTSRVISALLFAAFIGLSVLTVGVIYLVVQDFLQKREKDKFEKEEEARKKKGKKKTRVRARTGPRGFGQKIEVEEDDD